MGDTVDQIVRYVVFGQGPVDAFRWLRHVGFLGISFLQYAVATGCGVFLALWADGQIRQGRRRRRALRMKAALEDSLVRNRKVLDQIEAELGNPHATPFHPFDLGMMNYVAPRAYDFWEDLEACRAIEGARAQLAALDASLDMMRKSAADAAQASNLRTRCRQSLPVVGEALRQARTALAKLAH